jgi:hypothetical protein
MKYGFWCEGMAAWACVVLLSGCASKPKTSPGPDGTAYRSDKALQKVWTAEGFNFAGYDTIYVTETGATIAPSREQTANFESARRLIPDEFAAAIQQTHLFQHIVTREADIPPNAKVLRLETAITEFAKMGDPALIALSGKLLDQNRPVLQFEAHRGAGFSVSRVLGLNKRNKEIQPEDIRSMAKALAEFIRRKISEPRTGKPAS